MASIFGHAIVGYTVSKIISNNNSKLLLVLAIASTILPDIDVLTFNFGIPYEAPFGHRGFTHSIFFAMLWATLIIFFFAKFNRVIWWLVMFLSTISHGILDAMTSGGRGVGIFIPFPLAFSTNLVDLIKDENCSLSNATMSSGAAKLVGSLKCLSIKLAPIDTAPKDIDQPIL